jgi:outer membrane protein OmpA-like peptidoglycan-associated protein
MIKTEPIYFDTDKFEIRPDAAKELDKVVFIMKSNETIKIELGSYTDSRASDEYNLWLSEQRAIATVNYIVSKGIDANRILGKGYGETDLVNECENEVPCSEEQHQLNRRTEFVIVNPEVLEIKNASN